MYALEPAIQVQLKIVNFCLANSNEIFLKEALNLEILDCTGLSKKKDLKKTLMNILKDGVKNELILNVLTFMDFGEWKIEELQSLMDILE